MNTNIPFDPAYPYDLPFLPPHFNHKDSRFTELRVKARVELAELKAYSSTLPDQAVLLSPAILKEAIASSGIENINTTMMNVLQNQLFPEAEQKKADKEVLYYKSAVDEGFDNLQKYSLGTRTIRGIHKMLLTNFPGEYRKFGVKIEDSKTKETIYTPPIAEKINGLVGNLEAFMHTEDDIDPLIKASIIHYQFEAIHPFQDGNGRTGRILIVLYLVKNNLLHFPTLFISGYILKNRPEYYRVLLGITKNNNWNEYIEFMLQGFYLQAKETKDLLFKIREEYFRLKKELKTNYKSIYNSGEIIDHLFAYPIITAAKLAEELGCTWDTASNYLKILNKAGILGDKKLRKYHFYLNKKLLNILYI